MRFLCICAKPGTWGRFAQFAGARPGVNSRKEVVHVKAAKQEKQV